MTDDFECSSKPYLLNIQEPPLLTSNISLLHETCVDYEDGAIILDAIQGGVPPYSYSIDSSKIFKFTNELDSIVDLMPGFYTVTVEDRNNCFANTQIELLSRSPVNVEIIGPPYTIPIGESVEIGFTLDADIEIEKVLWSGGVNFQSDTSEIAIIRPLSPNNYYIGIDLIERTVGCPYSAHTRVLVSDGVYIANTFTPNGDGLNDIFTIQGFKSSVISVEELMIFNRWNEEVYIETDINLNEISFGWDGSFRGQLLPSGIYYYRAIIELVNREKVVKRGSIFLVR